MSHKNLIKDTLHLIDNWIDYQVYIKEIPGVSVGIYFEDETIFTKEYGYANLEDKTKLTNQHLFRIASHSKLFTATAIMKLYHEDKLSLDDRVSKYLDWFDSDRDKNLNQIRIHHLLTHSSGITRDGDTGHWMKLKFPSLEEIKSQVEQGISYFESSEILKYSNFGYTILGQIIEAVTGQSYVDYINEQILDPLEMRNTFVDVDKTNEAQHATGYSRKLPKTSRDSFPQINASVMHSATGFSSTTEDLIKFYKAHIMGNDVLFPDFFKREMQRIQFSLNKENRGFGFGILKFGKLEFLGHGGGYPGFITRSGLNQKHKMIVVALTNAVDGPALTLAMGIGKIVEYVLKNSDKFALNDDSEIINFDEITGCYANHWDTLLFTQISNKLVSISPLGDNPVEYLQIYAHKGNHNFRSPDKPMFDSPGQIISFVDGSNGEKVIHADGTETKRFHYSY
ncbi:MAG: serine hydrolase domain-containing protein [Candidatus Kariarchaeaceae archaeon]